MKHIAADFDGSPDTDLSKRLAHANQALRRRAEAILQEKSLRLARSIDALCDETLVTPDAMRQTIYELQVHQIELQMQNEELRRIQLELDCARSRYFDLYDLAPVAHCTLSETDLIVEANLAMSTLVGLARHALIGKPITRFIHKSAQDSFYLQRNRLLEQDAVVSFDLQMQKAGGEAFWALLAATVDRQLDHSVQLRLVLNDISAHGPFESAL